MSARTDFIAMYRERLLEVEREFVLYEDRVVVRAHWRLKGDFEHVVELAKLTPEIQELNIRYRVYRYAGWVMAIAGLLAALAFSSGGRSAQMAGQVAMGVMILATAVMIATFRNRRIHFARFNLPSGRAGLDIGSAGNDVSVFKEFVERVQRQIAKASKRA